MASYIILGACLLSLQQHSQGFRWGNTIVTGNSMTMTDKSMMTDTSMMTGNSMMIDRHQTMIYQKTPSCEENKAFQVLAGLLHNDWCMSTKELWALLATIPDPDDAHHCRRDLQMKFAVLYGRGSTKPSNCDCTNGLIPQWVSNDLLQKYEALPAHCKSNNHFKSIVDAVKNCTTHHADSVFQQDCKCFGQTVVVGHTDVTSTKMSPTVPTPVTSILPKLPTQCDLDFNVRTLLFLKDKSDICHNVDDVFINLQKLQASLPECMVIVDILADHYGTPNTTKCSCSGPMPAFNPFKDPSHTHAYATCSGDPYYKGLANFLFEAQPCIDQKLVWSPLHQISSKCRTDFINMAARDTGLQCACGPSSIVKAPVIEPVTTMPTTTTTTFTTTLTTTSTNTPPTTSTTTQTTTTSPTTTTTTIPKPYVPKTYSCDKFHTVMAVADKDVVSFNNDTDCAGGRISNDGFVISECNVTANTDDWHKGRQVMRDCQQVPLYIPVATFHPNAATYTPFGAQAGIFAGCLQKNGFRLIVEHCDGKGPVIVHIPDSGSSPGGLTMLQDPHNYFLIG